MLLLIKTRGLLLRVLGCVAVIIGLKLIVHSLGWEIISPNAIFSGLIGANVFLLGFLLSGVLSDFKESEKLPGELASIFYTVSDELYVAYARQKNQDARCYAKEWLDLAVSIRSWFYKTIRTRNLMTQLHSLYNGFTLLEVHNPPNYIVRLKQEHHNLRKLIIRIHTIRETDFVSSGYLIAMTTSGLMLAGLVFSKIEPYYESLFFVGAICYLMIFLILLIRDLDNPFGYYERSSHEDVSLKPLEDVIADLREQINLRMS